MSRFRYSFQSADMEADDGPPLVEAGVAEIRAALAGTNWAEQVSTANELERCSPTFAVQEVESEDFLWIAGCGDPENPDFICYLAYRTERPCLFGLFTRRVREGPPCRELTTAEAVRAVDMFLDRRLDEVAKLVSSE